jgi:putative oxidoreductase
MNPKPAADPSASASYLHGFARIVTGLLFFQHGAEKLWGFAGGRIDHNFGTLRGFAGPLEIVGGTLIALGLFTRFWAFILCGEMAVAYFRSWAPRGFFPIQNGGEEAYGAGGWSRDQIIGTLRFKHRTEAETAKSPTFLGSE